MRVSLFLLVVLFSANNYCQKVKFRNGVFIDSLQLNSKINYSDSILITFEGDTHLVNYFLDLESKIRKRAKKGYSKNFIYFDYNLISFSPLNDDLIKIPKNNYNKEDFNYMMTISLSEVKGWDYNLGYKRKQSYRINFSIENPINAAQVGFLSFDVKTYYTILKENKTLVNILFNNLFEL
ncbi:hypothetical protein ACFSQJ_14965 [Croceitalea marina]|uniref:Uncharacterized protein n=1 Tax=Croceitalea marina TaxID=1775166 RepID=A0ABW5MZA1_9FLAO